MSRIVPTTTAPPPPVPGVHTYKIECYLGTNTRDTVRYSNFKAAWEAPYAMCDVEGLTGTADSTEKAAVKAAAEADPYSDLELLFAICGRTDISLLGGRLSPKSAAVFKAALTICPDHPKVDELNQAIDVGEATAAENEAKRADALVGKYVDSGKYLVGVNMEPGEWQSQGSQVRDCYWEISDAQGEILDNAFISIAPQFNLYVPASAAGFTARNCSFRWING